MTGKPGAQIWTWYESVHITCRSPEAEAAHKAENERIYAPRRERAEKAKPEPATEAQVKYLTTLAEKVGKERFDAEFAKVIKGSDIAPRAPRELAKEAAKRGGPVALRCFYCGQGVIIGSALTGGAIAGTVAYDKWSKRRAAAAAEPVGESTTEASARGDAQETRQS